MPAYNVQQATEKCIKYYLKYNYNIDINNKNIKLMIY